MSTVLPHTRAWLALVSGQVPQLAQHLQPLTDFAGDNTRVQAAANAALPSAGNVENFSFHFHIRCSNLMPTLPARVCRKDIVKCLLQCAQRLRYVSVDVLGVIAGVQCLLQSYVKPLHAHARWSHPAKHRMQLLRILCNGVSANVYRS